MERALHGDEIKKNADLMAHQLFHIVEELPKVKMYPSSNRYLFELPCMGIDNIMAWHCHTDH